LCSVHARERFRENDTYIYDVEVAGSDGSALERWEGLRLRVVNSTAPREGWVEALLGPYVERRIRELIPDAEVAVAVDREGVLDRRARSDRAIQRALGNSAVVRRRPDGKPEIAEGREVSAAHTGDLTIAVAAPGPVGCDAEPVVARSPSVWRELLGQDRFSLAELIAREAKEDGDRSATRVWAAIECLKKAGAAVNSPLVLESTTTDGWVLLAAGPLIVTTFVASVKAAEVLALAVSVRNNHASL
jgi:enediyne polyketide synthase